jgi:peptide/nickel transport system ATP-binding protein
MIFQDPLSSLNPSQTIGEILTRPLSLYFGMSRSAAHDEAKQLLSDLELPAAHLERRPRMLSGGQQQRVAIARALAAKPDVIICDEITSALDVTIQALVLQLLKRLQADYGMAYLFISHDLAVVADMADDMIVLEHGQLRDYGSTHDVLENPGSPYTRRLLDAFRHGQRSVNTTAEPDTEDKALAQA